jgi:hypothetical protein
MTIEINHDDAVTAMAIIESNPDRWNQGSWRGDDRVGKGKAVEDFPNDPLNPECGTTGCLAGWVVFLNGIKWAGRAPGQLFHDMVQDPDTCTCAPTARICTCGNAMSVQEYARKRLGMSNDDADALFSGDNDLDDLRAGVKALANGESVFLAVHQSHRENDNEACGDCFDGWDDSDEEDE